MLLLTDGIDRPGFAGVLAELDERERQTRQPTRGAVEAAGALAPVGISRGARDLAVRAAVAAFADAATAERERLAS